MTTTEIRQKQLAVYSRIPEMVRFGVVHFIVFGYPLGGFLDAVFTNDLRRTIGSADNASLKGIGPLVTWLTSFAPSACHGSRKNVSDWCKQREEMLRHCYALKQGLEIFAELGDTISSEALAVIKEAGNAAL